jgi:hypothetical protein
MQLSQWGLTQFCPCCLMACNTSTGMAQVVAFGGHGSAAQSQHLPEYLYISCVQCALTVQNAQASARNACVQRLAPRITAEYAHAITECLVKPDKVYWLAFDTCTATAACWLLPQGLGSAVLPFNAPVASCPCSSGVRRGVSSWYFVLQMH